MLKYLKFDFSVNPQDTDEQKSSNSLNCLSTSNELSSPEEEEFPNVKKAKVDNGTRNSLASKEPSTANGTSLNLGKKVKQCTGFLMDDSKSESESEPEEGEITDSEQEDYSSEDEVTSEESVNSEETDSEGEFWLYMKYSSVKNVKQTKKG